MYLYSHFSSLGRLAIACGIPDVQSTSHLTFMDCIFKVLSTVSRPFLCNVASVLTT